MLRRCDMFIHTDQVELMNYDVRAQYRHNHPEANEATVDFGAYYVLFRRWFPYCRTPNFIM